MKVLFSHRFLRQYASAPAVIQKAFDKQCAFLLQDLHHPSLHAKKYHEAIGVWQARINRNWRFYFTIEGEEYRLHDIKPHPK